MKLEGEGQFSQVETGEGLVALNFSTLRGIGNGGYGAVYEIQGTIEGRSCKFAIKDYSKGNLPKHKPHEAVNAHIALESAGCKTLPTYQLIEEGGTQILMTLHDPDVFFIIDGKATFKGFNLVEAPEEEKADVIENFDVFIDDFFHQPILAGRAGCEFKALDVFHFTVDKETKSKADFWLGDLDLVGLPSRNHSDDEKLEIIKKNIRGCKEIMETFLNKEIKGEMKAEYLSITKAKYDALSKEDDSTLLSD